MHCDIRLRGQVRPMTDAILLEPPRLPNWTEVQCPLLGQKRTLALFDDLVCDGDHSRRNSEVERLGRGEIDNKLEFG